MAKRGIKEPEGSENWPTMKAGDSPCWWSREGKTDKDYATRAICSSPKYRENYEKIQWDKD